MHAGDEAWGGGEPEAVDAARAAGGALVQICAGKRCRCNRVGGALDAARGVGEDGRFPNARLPQQQDRRALFADRLDQAADQIFALPSARVAGAQLARCQRVGDGCQLGQIRFGRALARLARDLDYDVVQLDARGQQVAADLCGRVIAETALHVLRYQRLEVVLGVIVEANSQRWQGGDEQAGLGASSDHRDAQRDCLATWINPPLGCVLRPNFHAHHAQLRRVEIRRRIPRKVAVRALQVIAQALA